jgi:DNA transposition AAA+ family ATPase
MMIKTGVKNESRYISDIPFLITKQVKEMSSLCHAIIDTREMGVVYGEPGVGKTITAENIAKKWQQRSYPKAYYLEADVGTTPAGIGKKLLRAMADVRPVNAADAARIIENLSKEHEWDLIIIDEAERLNRDALDMIRSIHDRTKVPILLVGMSEIVRKLRSHKKFYSRIGIAYCYEPLSYKQLATYLGLLHPLLKEIDAAIEHELLEFIFESTRGEFRRINRLVKQTERVRKANNHPVLSLSVFEAASKLLLNVEPY